ncbi:unnamed protein product [Soboliphyme baturini]|uniref:PH domain-containing protein n=1 Tax=Soboliphyme baturini TaxID=241478 RepID=A0A183IB63_9BILA|nr:unnamed protein product [Soboliphyme baturini]
MQDNKEFQNFSGYLKLIESIGPLKSAKKRWFVLEHGGRFLYYYHNDKDVVPVGRVYLPTAAFYFDPKQPHCFEIRSNGKVKSFEAHDRTSCLRWLELLQNERHWCLEHNDKVHDSDSEVVTKLPHLSKFLERTSHAGAGAGGGAGALFPTENEGRFSMHKSVFYITEDGELKENSLKYPVNNDEYSVAVPEEGVEFSINSGTSVNVSGLAGGEKIGAMFHRLLKLSVLSTQKQCPNCSQLISVASSLKEKCVDLQDELTAARELIDGLQSSLKASQDQMDSMETLLKNSGMEEERLLMFLKSEKQVHKLKVDNSNHEIAIKEMNAKIQHMEETLEAKEQEVMALQRAVLSKDEQIVRLAEEKPVTDSGIVFMGQPADQDVSGYEDVTESILCSEVQVVDSGDQDIVKLQDLVHGYETQNQFLNKEILELQNVIRHLEGRESRISRRCFDVEAQFYQLKSRYLLLLNHFQPNKDLPQQIAGELMKEAEKSLSLPNTEPKRFTDDLGFYLAPKCMGDSRNGSEDLFLKAGELQKVSTELSSKKLQETDENYLNWLTRWDSFLVNFADKLVSPGPDLKELIRSGVPHTYRARVWKSLIAERTKDIMSEVGTGYFDCLCRINLSKSSEGYDPALKQIDLDLTRTLPNNIYFEDLQAEKIESLRRVLYSYRGHNPRVLFRFALAALKLNEEKILNCRTSSAVHSCLSKIGEELSDYRKLAEVGN